ncbi:MAG: PIN domain-containing protein [Candidatus Bathyarchaeia archaeon]
MRAVIDTNVLVYDTFGDSAFHGEARALLESLEEWSIPTIVMNEYVWLLRAIGVSAGDALEKVKEYLLHPKGRLICEEVGDAIRSLQMISSEGLSLSRFNDALILMMATRIKSPIASFDAKLRGQAIGRGLAVLPEGI